MDSLATGVTFTHTGTEQYTPVQDDPVDVALAKLLAQRRYRPFWSQFCRLGPNAYLCGITEVRLDLGTDDTLIAFINGQPQTLVSYLEGNKGTGRAIGQKT